MKNLTLPFFILFSILVFMLSSCSTNQFLSRRNYQPRVKVEAVNPIPVTEKVSIKSVSARSSDSLSIHSNTSLETKIIPQVQPKETIMEKMVKVFMPKKKAVFEPLFHPKKHHLNKVKHTTMDSDQITGLVISLLAVVLAVTAIFMIIGMAHGNVWVYFVVGLLLAIVALTMAFIAKKVLPFKGISLAAGVLAILALVLLVIFLILITVFNIIF